MQADHAGALDVLVAHSGLQTAKLSQLLWRSRFFLEPRPVQKAVRVLLFAFPPPMVEKRIADIFKKRSRFVYDPQEHKRDVGKVVLVRPTDFSQV